MVLSMERWVGKTAVVTGASAGIGVEIVTQLIEAGVNVVGLARRLDRMETLAEKLKNNKAKLYPYKADVSNEADILAAFKWTSENVGPVHILINNAGILQDTNLIEGDTQKWRSVFDVNVIGLCVATREAVKIMRKHNIDGHVIHINSISGHNVNYFPYMNVYSASKFAVTSLTETLRRELNTIDSKIKITSVSPGCVDTEIMQTNNIKLEGDNLDNVKTRAALSSSDCADAVMYALSTSPICQVHDLIIKPIGEVW